MTSLWRVARYARRHGAWLGVAAAAMVVVAIATVFAYNLVRPIYDELLAPTHAQGAAAAEATGVAVWLDDVAGSVRRQVERLGPSSRGALLALVVVAIALKAAGSFVAHSAVARLGLATVRDLRDALFESLLAQSPGWFASHPTPTLVSRVVHDVQVVSEALAERLGDLVQDSLTVVVLLAYALSLDLRLGLVTVVLAPLMVAPVVRLTRRLRRRTRDTLERLGDLATTLDESVRGIRVVQAFAAEGAAVARFRERTGRHLAAALRARSIQVANAPAMEVVGAIGAAALIGYASRRIAAGDMSLGDLSAFMVAVYGCYNPVKRLNKLHLALQQAAAAAERVLEIVDARSGIVESVDAAELEDVGEGVRVEGVWYAYRGEEWVLREVDLVIPRGRTVAVVGPSGAGKTTLAMLLPRFLDPQRGVVRVGGRDLRRVRVQSLRRRLGLVTQETLLFDDTVAANIAFGAVGAGPDEIEEAARAAGAHDFIVDLPEGYSTRLGEGGRLLSGGQRQRLAIARALLRDPDLLILDEATSALDAETERRVQASLERLAAGRTTLVIAHRLSTVRHADTIVVLDRGSVVERGTHDQLIAAAGLYARLYRDQANPGGPVL